MAKNEHGLDIDYFKKKLKGIVLDVDCYSPGEMYRELKKLSEVAGDQMVEKLAMDKIKRTQGSGKV